MKACIFDFDGTLADSFPLINDAYMKVFACYGIKVDEHNIHQFFGPSEDGAFIKALGRGKGLKAFKDYLDIYEKEHDEFIKPIDPRILSVLKSVKAKGFLLLLVTGRSRESKDISFRHLHIPSDLFAKVYCGSPEGVNKGESFKKAEEDYSLKPEDILYVGDSKRDILSCREAGVSLLSVNYYHTALLSYLEKNNPGRVVEDVDGLKPALEKELGVSL